MPEDPAHDQSPVRVAIADSNDLIRLGILGELRALESVKAAGEAGDLDSLVAVIDEHRPDVTFVDLELPGLQEHDNVTEPLRRDNPDLKAVVMSDDTTDMAVIRTFRSIANGFIVKDNTADLLGLAATSVATGGTFIDPQVASILFALTLKGQRNYRGPHGLTVQEQRVAALLKQRLTNREIGEQLGITAGTVKTHVGNAVAKLGADDRYEAAEIAEREHISAPGS